jgi:uncharacterized protein YjlB
MTKPPAPDERVEQHFLGPDGDIPNNPRLPLLVYRDVLPRGGDAAAACERLFAEHGWGDGWRNGIHPYHHFHSTAHEALGIVHGHARVRFGGEHGISLEAKEGDVVVIPAGVAHKRESASPGLLVVGVYPVGQDRDLCTGKPEERETALGNVAAVASPKADPIYGARGPLMERWARRVSW